MAPKYGNNDDVCKPNLILAALPFLYTSEEKQATDDVFDRWLEQFYEREAIFSPNPMRLNPPTSRDFLLSRSAIEYIYLRVCIRVMLTIVHDHDDHLAQINFTILKIAKWKIPDPCCCPLGTSQLYA